MTKISWDSVGARFFEIGVDRGVLYPAGGDGVPWNGLISVTESPSGGEPKPFYIDGEKFLNIPSIDEFAGTIVAFTYPDEFEECDGTARPFPGLGAHQQRRKAFGLSYRTRVGNDLEPSSLGYKIHIVYNALVQPSSKTYETTSTEPEAMNFSWEFSTTPVDAGTPYLATAHFTIDSNKISAGILSMVEDALYGTDASPPTLLTPEMLYDIFDPTEFSDTFELIPDTTEGLWSLSFETGADLAETTSDGFYEMPVGTRLVESDEPGLYTLET